MNLDLIVRITTVVVSFTALIVSIIVAWSNRKSLHVEIDKNLHVLDNGDTFLLDKDDCYIPFDQGVLSTIEVVNPSPKDIAFFDLRAFNPETNINIHLITKRTLPLKHRESSIFRKVNFPMEEENITELSIPDTNYGVFKANSFTRFHIIMFPPHDLKELNLAIKVAIRAKVKDQFAVTERKKFKFYGVTYDISSWTEVIKQQQQSMKE